MSPAEELRAAAARVRELASRASPGPWYANKHIGGMVVMADSLRRDGYAENADWIIAMSPAVAEPLAAVLDEAADHIERGEDETLAASELSLARAILESA